MSKIHSVQTAFSAILPTWDTTALIMTENQ